MNNLSFSVKSYFCRFIKQQIYSYYLSFHSSHFSDLKARSLNFEPEASALKHCLCNVVEDFDQVNSNKLKSLEKMSVLIVTSLGDIVVDLYSEKCPLTAKNFLKLCKIKYYNGCLFHTVQKDFTAQTGDPTGTGSGGDSIYKFLYGEQARFFSDEIHLDLKHAKTGTLAMASAGENLNASQFYFTLRDDLDYLDGKHVVFGEIAEGLETLTRINEAFTDEKGRPFKNIRIKHTYILDDPFEDPPQISEFIPDASPEGKPKDEVEDEVRLEDDWVPMDEQMDVRELEEVLRSKEAHSRAVVLETIGDIPDAEIKPPENVLFVCKLNPVTEDEDLHTIFSRFGTVTSAEVIRDFKTGDSLCYAFIEFETDDACEQAYFKMDNALIDDRRIHVDFSQSVSKLWSQYRRKSHQTGSGKGCFKCGETDHIAKDCGSEGTKMKKEEKKYVVKNDDRQRGGRENSRYEMVFDEDTRDSPEKQNRGRDQEERAEKRSREHPIISEDSRHKSRDKSDPRATERGRTDREHRERREKRSGERDDRDHRNTARADGNGRSDERRDDRDYRKKVSDKDDRSRDYRRSNDHRNRDENRKRNSGEDRYTRENERKEHKRREEDVTDDRDRERRYRRDDKKR